MENKVNPNGVNNENEAVKKAAPPPMKRVKKGEQSAAVKKAAKNIEEKKNATSAKKAEAKEQIKEVINKTPAELETEIFVHGALCYCYSGQCLLSSMIGGRSGNRGRCAQPCRMAYDVYEDGKVATDSDLHKLAEILTNKK